MTEHTTRDGQRIVVLGASGFIGSAVSAALCARPVRLRLVSRRPAAMPRGAVADVEMRAADLTVPGALADAVADADTVIHLVAHTDGGWRGSDGDTAAKRVNLGLVEDLAQACRSGRRGAPPPAVVFASSALINDDQIDSAYCRQKLTAERVLAEATEEGVLRGISLRLPAAYGYGPAADPRVIELMVRRALAGEELTLWHDGAVRRDLMHLDDVAAVFLDTIDNIDALAGSCWPIGTGCGEPLGKVFAEISQLVADYTGEPAVSVVTVAAPANSGPTDLVDLEIDSSRFRAVTGWQPRISLRQGLLRTIAELAAAPARGGTPSATSP